jgi:phytoene dehydrogenase-like protein
MTQRTDVIVVGAGHNGLVSALMLARAGRTVTVLEASDVVGGACRTEQPFPKAPGLKHSTGAYLLGLMPPELLATLGIDLPLLRRDPHYFLPTEGAGYLLFGSNREAFEAQMLRYFSAQDLAAHQALQAELSALREDVAATWLTAPLSIEDTAQRYVRPALREIFIALCRGSIGDYLARFAFKSELIQAMYAVTDGFSGLAGGWDTPGTGHNFLVHNMCRLPGSDGTWMMVRGGMGTVTQALAHAARAAGAKILVDSPVQKIVVENGHARGVVLAQGQELRADCIVVNADPFRMRELVGAHRLDAAYNARLDRYVRPGSTLKLNLALRDLPRFTCFPEQRGQHQTTMHLLPQGADVLAQIKRGHAQAMAGELPDFPTIEWYLQTTLDPSLQDDAGNHSSALFVQWVPLDIRGSSWEAEGERYADHLLSICDRFAPGTSELVVDRLLLHPRAIEERFGIRHGHIHHVDNCFGFNDRLPYETPIAGLFSASAGCHPAGSVIGAAGHNCAVHVLAHT